MLAKTIRRPVQVTLKELDTLKTVTKIDVVNPCSKTNNFSSVLQKVVKKKFYMTRCMVASKKNSPR